MADITAHPGADTVSDQSAYPRRLVLEGLPQHAQSRYRNFTEQLLELEAQSRHLRERREALSQRAQVASHNAMAAKANATASADHHEQAAAAAEHELEEVNRRFSKINAARVNIEQIINRLNEWLVSIAVGTYRGPAYTDSEPSPAKLAKGEDFAAAIMRMRDDWSKLQMELAQTTAAPPPASEIRAMVRAELERRHAEAAIGFRFEHDALGGERFSLFAPDLSPWGADMHPMGLVTGWLLRIHGVDEILEMFCAGLDDAAPGIPRADKPRIVAELEVKVIEAELAECSYIDQAIGAGLDVQYRPNASPLALLHLQPVRPQQPMEAAA